MIEDLYKPSEPYTLIKNAEINPLILKLMSAKKAGYCRIANGRWIQLGMQKVCPKINKWAVKNLDIEQNMEQNILIHISNIKFTSLISLNLTGNLIQSVQALVLMNCRNLEQLNLTNNKITNLKSLRLLHTMRLRTLKICNNLFTQINCLSEMPLMNMEALALQNQANKKNCSLNLWQLGKFESIHMKSLYVRNWLFSFKNINKNGQSIFRQIFIELNPGRNI